MIRLISYSRYAALEQGADDAIAMQRIIDGLQDNVTGLRIENREATADIKTLQGREALLVNEVDRLEESITAQHDHTWHWMKVAEARQQHLDLMVPHYEELQRAEMRHRTK